MYSKEISFTVNRKELVYDIQNETSLRGHAVDDGNENFKEASAMQASNDSNDIDKITRSIQKGVANIKVALSEYLNESNTTPNSDIVDTEADIIISLMMPSNFNEAASAGLAENAHNYLMNIAVSDWYLVTNPSDSENYLTLAQASMQNLRKAVYQRSRPERPSRTSD